MNKNVIPTFEATLTIIRLWYGIKSRCFNKNDNSYRNYGARGITMHEAWRHSLRTFLTDIYNEIGYRPSNKHSLDRIDNNGNYQPGNIRWADRFQQAANQTHTKLCDGISQAAFARLHGVTNSALVRRIHRGQTPHEAVAAIQANQRDRNRLYNGMTMTDLARLHGFKMSYLSRRLKRGETLEQAIAAIQDYKRRRNEMRKAKPPHFKTPKQLHLRF